MARSLDDLMQVVGELSDEDCNTVLAFARFLREQSGPREPQETDPVAIPRPDDETVINAISRLTATYPMLNKRAMMAEVSGLMMEHIRKGEPAGEVIDRLENLFRERYEALSGLPESSS